MSDACIAKNKAVLFTYMILDGHGNPLEQSDIPVGYVHGAGSELLPKLEHALEGCRVGDMVKVEMSPEEGFGPYDPSLTFTDDVENVPPELRRIGAEAQMQNDQGEVKTFFVTKIEDGKLTVDGNHPFAGRDVVFQVSVQEIRDATPEEIQSGYPEGQAPPVAH